MRKILIGLLLIVTLGANSQKTAYHPYANVGSTLSSGQFSYGGEVGIYTNKVWYAVGASTYEQNDVMKWTGSVKGYYKVFNEGFVDNYVWGAINVDINSTKFISLEPGVAAVFNVSKRWSPQISLSFPVGENSTSLFKPLKTNFGVSLNYWIK